MLRYPTVKESMRRILQMSKTRAALWLTLAMTAVTTVLRIALIPRAQNVNTGLFHISYVVVAVMLAVLLAAAALLVRDRAALSALPPVRGRWLLPTAAAVMLVGLCILLTAIVDMYRWGAAGVTPPPAKVVTGPVDRITLFLSLIFGVLAGIYFIRLGLLWITENGEVRGRMPFWGLTPTLWIWMRLARYEVSYASAVEVYESFYDFAMLLFMLLFLFSLARSTGDINAKRPKRQLFYALGTALTAVSGPLARVGFYLLGEGDAYRAGQLAGLPDLAVGVLAAGLAVYWVLASPPAAPEDIPDDQTE